MSGTIAKYKRKKLNSLSPQSNIWPKLKMTFESKSHGKFPESAVLISSPTTDYNAKRQCEVKGRYTVCRDVTLDLRKKTCQHTNISPYKGIFRLWTIHTYCICTNVCKYRHKQMHMNLQENPNHMPAHNTHLLTLSINYRTFLLVVKWPCCHSFSHLFPWGRRGE